MAEYTISKASDNKATAGVAATASPTAMASKNTVSSAGSQAGSYGSGASVVSNTNSNGNGRNGNGNNNGNNQYSRRDTSPDAGPPARVGRIEVIPAETESPDGGLPQFNVDVEINVEDEHMVDPCAEVETGSPVTPATPYGEGETNRPEVGGITPPDTSTDLPDNFKGSWFKNNCNANACCAPPDANESASDTTSYLTVTTLVSTDKTLTSRLSKGDFRLLDDPRYADKFQIEKIPASGYASVASHKGGKADFTYKASFTVPKDVKDATLFTYTSYDVQKMMQDYDLGFRSNFSVESNIPRGKVSSEKLISNGSVPTKSYVYTDSATGEVWDGPVHYHVDKGYMAGASHTEAPHSSLDRQQMPNIKVKNFTGIKEIGLLTFNATKAAPEIEKVSNSSFSLPISTPDNILLEFGATIDDDGNGRISFDVDIFRTLQNNSAYGSIMENPLSEQTLKDISMFSNIDKIEIFRKREDEAEEELIAFSSQLAGQAKIARNTLETSSVIGAIEEKSVYKAARSNIRTFVATDYSLSSQPDGVTFVYGVKIELSDGIKEVLTAKHADLSNAITELEGWQLTAYGASNSSLEPLNKSIATYVDVLNTVTEGINKIKAADTLYSFANPVSGNSDNAHTVIEMMKTMDVSLGVVLPIAKSSQPEAGDSTIRQSDNFFKDNITIENTFESRSIATPKEVNKFSAEFNSNSLIGPVNITKEQYNEKNIYSESGEGFMDLEFVPTLRSASGIESLGMLNLTIDISGNSIGLEGFGLISAEDRLSGDDNFTKNISNLPPVPDSVDQEQEGLAAYLFSSLDSSTETISRGIEYHSYIESDVGAKISLWQKITPDVVMNSQNTIYRCRIKAQDNVQILNNIFFLGQETFLSSQKATSNTKDIVKEYLDKYTNTISSIPSTKSIQTGEVSGQMRSSGNYAI